jgi:hypothetical protein
MKSFYFICSFFLCISTYAQENILHKEIYNFMNEVAWREGKYKVYCKPLMDFDSMTINLLINSKSYKNQLFTAKDIAHMKDQFLTHQTNNFLWSTKYITNEKLRLIKRKYCLSNKWFIRSFAVPLFTEDSKIALLIDWFSGYSYVLYKREKDRWIMLELIGGEFSSPP